MRIFLAFLLIWTSPAYAQPSAGSLATTIEEGLALGFPGIGLRVETRDGRQETIVRGVADVAAGSPMQLQHRFLSFSITKVFVAVLAHKLIEEGRLRQTDRMIDLLGVDLVGRIEHSGVITVGQLLDHSSGIYDIFDDPSFRAATNGRNADLARRWTPQELIAFAYDRPAIARPGVGRHYSNTNYDLLGLIIERVTGQTLATAIAERIVRPLGLNDTFLVSFGGNQKDYVKGYAPDSQELRDAGFDYPFPAVNAALLDVSALNYSYEWAAGGIVSSLDDLARFARALLLNGFVSPATLEAMQGFSPRLANLRSGQFAIGSGLEGLGTPAGPAVGHSGDGLGYTAFMFQHQADGTIVVAFANAVGLPGGDAFFLRLFSEAVLAARAPDFGNQSR